MIDADLRFGSGAESERYAEAVDDVCKTIVDRVYTGISASEDKAYLHEGFTRYLPPDEQVTGDFILVDFYLQTFISNLTRGGLDFEHEAAMVWLATQYVEAQQKIDAVIDEYAPLFASYCRSAA